jgi:DNA integrity scanning protein DisA with diadenylate cyclase activity
LLLSIFNKNSPLHDGAVIIYKSRIKAARCVLPVSENDHIPANYGLRHRAAVGMSENTDTLVLAISEETGRTLLARNGQYIRSIKLREVEKRIMEYLHDEEPPRWEDKTVDTEHPESVATKG